MRVKAKAKHEAGAMACQSKQERCFYSFKHCHKLKNCPILQKSNALYLIWRQPPQWDTGLPKHTRRLSLDWLREACPLVCVKYFRLAHWFVLNILEPVGYQTSKGLLETSVFVGRWVGTRFSANPQIAPIGRKYATCILAEGPYVYFGRRPLTLCNPTLCGPDVHLVSRGWSPRKHLVCLIF